MGSEAGAKFNSLRWPGRATLGRRVRIVSVSSLDSAWLSESPVAVVAITWNHIVGWTVQHRISLQIMADRQNRWCAGLDSTDRHRTSPPPSASWCGVVTGR